MISEMFQSVARAARIRQYCKNKAAAYGVSYAVHPNDHIFNFLMANDCFENDEQRVSYYFDDGSASAQQFWDLLKQYDPHKPLSDLAILEFASGYGCVSRHLVKKSAILCCDIHPKACQFLKRKIGVQSWLSASVPEELGLPGKYDVIFALSFFSHMPITTWTRWLRRLAESLKPGGLLLFTTHGRVSLPHFGNPEMPDSGFWFSASSEQKDLSTEEYGQTVVTKDYVFEQIATVPHAELIDWREACWWKHQDLYTLRQLA